VSGLVISTRYELTLALLVLYLGLLDGPIKLISASQAASAIRDVLILAIGLGMIVRLLASRKRVRMPPLSGWVLAFVVTVLVETVNPNTAGVLKIVGGFRQQLEWVPFFFFALSVDPFEGALSPAVRPSRRDRPRQTGSSATVQTRLSPTQLASWGPGYSQLVEGTNGLGGRTSPAAANPTCGHPPSGPTRASAAPSACSRCPPPSPLTGDAGASPARAGRTALCRRSPCSRHLTAANDGDRRGRCRAELRAAVI